MIDEQDALLQPVERGYVSVLRVRFILAWTALLLVVFTIDMSRLIRTPYLMWPTLATLLVALLVTTIAPKRIWLRLRYALEPNILRVVRGWLYFTDTLVPLPRVQHLDITRGPLEKLFGTATLVVHTAGTHSSTVMLPGLSPARAEELAGVIRSHIRVDAD